MIGAIDVRDLNTASVASTPAVPRVAHVPFTRAVIAPSPPGESPLERLPGGVQRGIAHLLDLPDMINASYVSKTLYQHMDAEIRVLGRLHEAERTKVLMLHGDTAAIARDLLGPDPAPQQVADLAMRALRAASTAYEQASGMPSQREGIVRRLQPTLSESEPFDRSTDRGGPEGFATAPVRDTDTPRPSSY